MRDKAADRPSPEAAGLAVATGSITAAGSAVAAGSITAAGSAVAAGLAPAADTASIRGLALSRRYYETYGADLLAAFPNLKGRVAIGLVGEGSQCFGFDDAISQDHDFAPGFCLWLREEDFARQGAGLKAAYDRLPSHFLGFSRDNLIASDRLGVMSIGGFYSRFTGTSQGVPATNMDWLLTPESQLAAATNGAVFEDEDGTFTAIRNRLLDFYPEDVRRKKIAARASIMSQAGQYNLLRLIKRHDKIAALLAMARFTEATLSMIYLLNRRYMPFYKWAFHGIFHPAPLPLLAQELKPRLDSLPQVSSLMEQGSFSQAYELAFELTEGIASAVAAELRKQGISAVMSDFLQDHLADIMSGIGDPQIASLHPMVDCPN